MKKLINYFVVITCTFIINNVYAQFTNVPTSNLTGNCAGINDVVLNSRALPIFPGTPINNNRFGILHNGTWGGNGINDQYLALGYTNFLAPNLAPNASNLYGFSSSWNSDRVFFGLRKPNNLITPGRCIEDNLTSVFDNSTQAVIGWGNDSNNIDRLLFEFYNCCGGNTEVATMLPNGNVGIGTINPTARFHVNVTGLTGTTQIRFEGLNTTTTENRYLVTDVNGNVFWRNLPTIPSLTCGTTNFVPKVTGAGVLGCSQIFDNATNVGISTTTPTDRLDINGTTRVRSLPTKAVTDKLVFANATSGQLHSLAPSGLTTQYLAGNGTWQNFPVSGNVSSTCTTANFLPRVSTTGSPNLICSQVFDNSTSVGIGTTSPFIWSKLHIFNNINPIATFSESNNNTTLGISSHNITTNNTISIGTTGFVQGANTTTSKIGIWGIANANSCSGNNVGVYGSVNSTVGLCGTHFAGYFAGQMLSGGPVLVISDSTLKTNVNTISDASGIINSLLPKTYQFESSNTSGFALTNKLQYGFISQEVERVLPDVVQNIPGPANIDNNGNVTESSKSYKAMNYDALIAILVKGFQEQTIRINDLENQLNLCCSSSARMHENSISTLENNNIKSIVLNQNVPNPFAEKTIINYTIPNNFIKAQIIITNINGSVSKIIDVSEKGEGNVVVFGNDLTSGNYIYTLIVDGVNIDSKKMMVSK